MNINFKHGFYISNNLYEFETNIIADKKYYEKLKKVLKIKSIYKPIVNLIRVGNNFDGGYLMSNNFTGKVAYSFGICDDVSWDNSIADRNYNIYMYDHTIDHLPFERKEFHYFKEGLSGKNEWDKPLKTIEHYIAKNGHENEQNMLLKMDVEGAEWDFIKTVSTRILKQFDQITLELHNMITSEYGFEQIKLLKKLNKTHQLVHIHGNNTSAVVKIGDTYFPNVVEVTYLNKDNYKFVSDPELELPDPNDAPNDRGRSDIILGKWNKSIKFK